MLHHKLPPLERQATTPLNLAKESTYGSSELNRHNQFGLVTLSSSMKKPLNESLDSSICADFESFKPVLRKSMGCLDKNIIVTFRSVSISVFTQNSRHPFQQIYLPIQDMKELIKFN